MSHIPEDHPRYLSLMARERLVDALAAGYLAPQGLTAHGRGEAFDYLIGETTMPSAQAAIEAAGAALVAAERPVLSVNGNVAALCPEAIAALQSALDCRVEVNLFHRTDERVAKIVARLEDHGCREVLGAAPDAAIPGLTSARGMSSSEGIHGADVVLVPLEDGDRCEALVAMGKTVITIDLNPLSRTARKASITIVDNVVRAVPRITEAVGRHAASPPRSVQAVVTGFDNSANLATGLTTIRDRLAALAASPDQLDRL